jgi:EmrB/QacA subfamily drug resistance transporter
MMVGFFMILLDSTIVAVANPSIMTKLGTNYDTVIWVTSAYLLGYAVPLLVAGRLGDRFGPKNLYLAGLAVFTAASLWCGLSGTIGMLIAARVVQGIGAGVLTPQTLSVITRIFPPERRGMAMSVWGATAGVATLVGPLAGGVLVDGLGWAWIFFVNVPVGIIGLGLAIWLMPVLPTHRHRFDLVGVGLSGLAMFLIVFALQEGQSGGWAPWIWAVFVAGIGLATAFVYWQSITTDEPLIPLAIFRDRDFSLANFAGAVIGFAATAMVLPLMFYAQTVCGLSPTRSALLTAPMAITSGLLAPIVGKIVDRSHPRAVVGFGFSVLAIGLTWLSIAMTPSTPIWQLVLPFIALGVGMAFIWAPLAATATRNLPARLAGAGSGVYNATRQVGAVLGSAAMASFMTSRITAEMPPMPDGGAFGPAGGQGTALELPGFLREPFAAAMSQSLLLPAFVALFGVVAAMFLLGFASPVVPKPQRAPAADDYWDDDDYVDDDHYVEFTVSHDGPEPSTAACPAVAATPIAVVDDHDDVDAVENDDDTEPMSARREHPLTPPADTWHDEPVDDWRHWEHSAEVEHEEPPAVRRESARSLYDFLGDVPVPKPSVEPIGFAHNGLHVDEKERFQPVSRFEPHDEPSSYTEPPKPDILSPDYPLEFGSHAHHESPDDAGLEPGLEPRHGLAEGQSQSNGRHYRADSDDAPSHGRHSRPGD